MPSNNQHLHVEFVDGISGKNMTAAQRLGAMVQFQKAVAEKYPDAVGIYGNRITGGKAKYGGDTHQFVPLKEGWDRKSLQEDIAPWTIGLARRPPQDAPVLRENLVDVPEHSTPAIPMRPATERRQTILDRREEQPVSPRGGTFAQRLNLMTREERNTWVRTGEWPSNIESRTPEPARAATQQDPGVVRRALEAIQRAIDEIR